MIEILEAGPQTTVQDEGRPGFLAEGLARGGAADRRALREAAALLGGAGAAIEVAGAGLRLRLHAAATVALTGAPMRADVGGRLLAWHAAHALAAGDELALRPGGGVFGYVTPAGGVATEPVMGSRAVQAAFGIGRALRAGDRLPVGGGTVPERRLAAPEDRFAGGTLRCVPTPQTALFAPAEVERFEATAFRRDPRGDRRGVRLASDAAGFETAGQLALLSDFVLPGDVQMTGDGTPYILGPDAQTTGGYPRIAHVVAADLPRAMQAPPGASLRFRMIGVAEARLIALSRPATAPLLRDPTGIRDLGAFQLIDGVVDARG